MRYFIEGKELDLDNSYVIDSRALDLINAIFIEANSGNYDAVLFKVGMLKALFAFEDVLKEIKNETK